MPQVFGPVVVTHIAPVAENTEAYQENHKQHYPWICSTWEGHQLPDVQCNQLDDVQNAKTNMLA